MKMMMNLIQAKSKKMKKIKAQEEKGNTWVIVMVVIALLMAFSVQFFLLTLSRIEGESMDPVLEEKDWILTYNQAYRTDSPEHNDIILFRKKDLNNEIIVKRIIGLPYDMVEIKSGEIFINGELFLNDVSKVGADYNMTSITVPEDCYFVMGDNRSQSIDSRHWDNPFIRANEIIGKVILK